MLTTTEHRSTQHFRSRAAERSLPSGVAEFLMTWGTETRAAGASHITPVRRDLPPTLRDSEDASRAEGSIIVAGDDGTLVTCYRPDNTLRFLRRKSQWRPRRRSRRA